MTLYLKSFNHGVSQSSHGVTLLINKLTFCVLHNAMCFMTNSVKLSVTPRNSVVKFFIKQLPGHCNLNFKIC